MLSGAIQIDSDIEDGGTYLVSLRHPEILSPVVQFLCSVIYCSCNLLLNCCSFINVDIALFILKMVYFGMLLDINNLHQVLLLFPQFHIQAAKSSLRAVTSVVFFDGPKGVFADFTPILFDHDVTRPADSGTRSNGMKIVSKELPGDTSSGVPEVELQERRAFGFQIYPGENVFLFILIVPIR